MLRSGRFSRVLWAGTGGLALVAAVAGVGAPGIYDGLIARETLPGALSQDMITIVVAGLLILLAVRGGDNRPKARLIALGLLGYLFYAFGIYTIERVYNQFYLLYLAIFALSFWALVPAAITVTQQFSASARLARLPRIISGCGALLQPLIFYPLWVAMLLALMSTRTQIDSLYSIFILDLCFVMPAFLILGVLTLRNAPIGLLLAPPMYVLGSTLILSLALAELVKPVFGDPIAVPSLLASLALTALFIGLGIVHLSALTVREGAVSPASALGAAAVPATSSSK